MLMTNPWMPIRKAQVKLQPEGPCFSHAEAYRMFCEAISEGAKRVVIDLGRVENATTAAFAQLVLLRRSLLRTGRDLCLTGLRDRTAGVFQVNRLDAVLPTV
jgi:anti-anti-sigma regulatory factor